MFEYLEQLRQKPKGVRKRVAFLVSFSFAGLILLVWTTVVYPNFSSKQEKQGKVTSSQPSPFSTFAGAISNGASAITSQLEEVRELAQATSTPQSVETATTTANEAEEPSSIFGNFNN